MIRLFIRNQTCLRLSKRSTVSVPRHNFSEATAMDSLSDGWAPRSDMLHAGRDNRVIVLAGATSVGKSKVAQLLCKELGEDKCEIIVADSVQIYRHLDIGSNKPSAEERGKVLHHCVDLCEPSEGYSCGEFVRNAVPIIYDVLNRGNVPIIVGGSTMWIQWLVRGIPDAPKASPAVAKLAEELLRAAEDAQDWEAARDIVAQYDSKRASTINANDFYRCRRYLEVALQLRQGGEVMRGTVDRERVEALPGLDVRCYFLSEDREQLYRTIDSRCHAMIDGGLIQETASLLENGILTPETPSSKAIGYRQTIELLRQISSHEHGDDGRRAFDTYLANFCTATRNYAKRQLHWYRKDSDFLWLRISRTGNAAEKVLRPDANVGAEEIEIGSSSDEGTHDDYAPYRKVMREILHWQGQPRGNYRQLKKQQILRAKSIHNYRLWKSQKVPLKVRITEHDWVALAALVASGELKAPQARALAGDSHGVFGAEIPTELSSNADLSMSELPSARNTRIDHGQTGAANEDDDMEVLAIFGSSRAALPRTLPAFPDPPLPTPDWTAEEVMIRATEGGGGNRRAKGAGPTGQAKSATAFKLKTYNFQSAYSEEEVDSVISVSKRYAERIRSNNPYLLDDFKQLFGG
eukprot:GSChrysophyteH1.ASY1.ANO1.3219.1 assembled CDS